MFHPFREARRLRAGRLIALCALAVLPLAGLVAAPPPPAAPTGAPQIGVIDLDKVMSGFKGTQVAQGMLEDFRSVREKLFNDLQKGIGLPGKDFNDYAQDVIGNGEFDKKHIEDMQTTAKKNMDEYQGLRDKAVKNETMTDADKTRLDKLNADVQEVSHTLKTILDAWKGEMDDQVVPYLDKLNESMNKAVEAYTKNSKYVVFNRNIKVQDTSVQFVWGGEDLTAKVIKSMNDNYDAKMFEAIPVPKPKMPSAAPAMIGADGGQAPTLTPGATTPPAVTTPPATVTPTPAPTTTPAH